MTTLRLKKREERRLLAGHDWVFSNEIDTRATPLKGLTPGMAVVLESVSGRFLAHAQANPHSLIAARVLSRDRTRPFGPDLLRQRLATALSLRERLYERPYYRWIHGEGDWLPGLVVDRYGDTLVVQLTTAGMELCIDELMQQLSETKGVKRIQLRNDVPIRELEQLPLYQRWALGETPGEIEVIENELRFVLDAEGGQKTGWFYDHRDSRLALRRFCHGKRVLELYSYLGAFGLNAAVAGAREVVAIDASAKAVARANENARLNGLDDRFQARRADAVEALREFVDKGARFDVVVLDPPAFIKRRKDLDRGTAHYALNNRLAMQLLEPGGILLTASCSQALDAEALDALVRRNLPRASTGFQRLKTLEQGADHPVRLAMPETRYLKGMVGRVV